MNSTLNPNQKHVKTINYTISLFGDDHNGCYLRLKLMEYRLNRNNEKSKNISQASRHAGFALSDIWQASILVSRIQWMHEMLLNKSIDAGDWKQYTQLDIDNFYVQLRSSLDHLAQFINYTSLKPGQIPKSFSKLRNSSEQLKSKLNPDIYKIIKNATWYDELKAIRDSLVHLGSESIVFGSGNEGLLFQIHDTSNFRPMINKNFMAYNENVAYFDRFAAWAIAHTLYTFDQVGHAILTEQGQEVKYGGGRSYCPGYDTIRQWMRELLLVIDSPHQNHLI